MGKLFIGLMSGTSVDSIDAALIECSPQPEQKQPTIRLTSSHNEPISVNTRNEILRLCEDGPAEIDRMGQLDRKLGRLFAQACNHLLANASVERQQISAIGSHGQTIRHRPPNEKCSPEDAFSIQIGDPNTIAELTGITTVADFRRRDIAAGGQGAPLVPRFHEAAFANEHCNRAIINIGGMANISILRGSRLCTGYDTGPGNVLMDAWINLIHGASHDQDGHWARQGSVNKGLLTALLDHPFFNLEPPKSTGRETFNLTWLQQMLKQHAVAMPAADVQATLLELSACSISQSLLQSTIVPQEIYVCGGGAHNLYLMERLTEQLAPSQVLTTTPLGIAPDWVEASAFAWLARQTLLGLSSNSPPVTGAAGERILGGIFPAL